VSAYSQKIIKGVTIVSSHGIVIVSAPLAIE